MFKPKTSTTIATGTAGIQREVMWIVTNKKLNNEKKEL